MHCDHTEECAQFFKASTPATARSADPSPCSQLPTTAPVLCRLDRCPPVAILYPLECEYRRRSVPGEQHHLHTGTRASRKRRLLLPVNRPALCGLRHHHGCRLRPVKYVASTRADGSNCGPPLPSTTCPLGARVLLHGCDRAPQCIVVRRDELHRALQRHVSRDNTTCNRIRAAEGRVLLPGRGGIFCVRPRIECETALSRIYHGNGTSCNPNPCFESGQPVLCHPGSVTAA